MAAFDFPSSPSVNQTYTANGVTWKWNGAMWMRVSGAGYLEKIEEGNSKVEVDDSGSGNITATTDGTERLRIDSSGNLGLGTQTPNKNSWNKAVTLEGSSNCAYEISDNGTLAAAFALQGNDRIELMNFRAGPLTFKTQNTERLRIDSDGRLLLGLNASAGGNAIFQVHGSGNKKAQFHQPDSGNCHIQFTNTQTGTSSNNGVEIGLGGDEQAQIWNYYNSYFRIATNNAERLRIAADGRVKINTSGSAAADLHVGGTSGVLNSYFQTSSSTGAYHKYSLGDNGADLGYFGSARQISSSGQSAGFCMRSQGHVEFCTGGSAERVRIDSSGRLGLGVVPEAYHSNNKAVIRGDSGYAILGRGDNALNISQNFYYDSSDAGKYIANGEASVYQQLDGQHIFYSAASGSANAGASLVERLRITSAGKVLINSTDDSNATMVVKTLTDNNHPTIKVRGTNANGYTFLGDEYLTDESQFTMGLAYSGASLVTGWGVRVSTSVNDTYLSSQDTYSTKHSAIKHDGNGWRFLSNSTSQTVTNGSTVSLSERFRIGSDGDITIRGTNSQYVEAAAFQQTQASKNAIVANNGGYVSFDPLRNTNSTIISHDPNSNSGRRITFPVAGAVHFSMYQDIKVSGTTGYTQCRLYKNGTVDRYALITYTNNQWDTIMMNTVVEVAANDYLEVYYTGGTITSMDNSAWLSYNFIFYPINTNRG